MRDTTAEPIVTSTPHRMSSGSFIRALASLKGLWPGVLLTLGVVVAVVLGITVDLRWLIVAGMIAAIVSTLIIYFLYAAYALSPRCLPCVHDHRIEVWEQELVIIYKVLIPAPEPEEGEEPGEPELRTVTVLVPRYDVRCRVGLSELTLIMRRPFGFLRLPYSCISDSEALIKWAGW